MAILGAMECRSARLPGSGHGLYQAAELPVGFTATPADDRGSAGLPEAGNGIQAVAGAADKQSPCRMVDLVNVCVVTSCLGGGINPPTLPNPTWLRRSCPAPPQTKRNPMIYPTSGTG